MKRHVEAVFGFHCDFLATPINFPAFALEEDENVIS